MWKMVGMLMNAGLRMNAGYIFWACCMVKQVAAFQFGSFAFVEHHSREHTAHECRAPNKFVEHYLREISLCNLRSVVWNPSTAEEGVDLDTFRVNMRGRTLLFWGDSTSAQMAEMLACLMVASTRLVCQQTRVGNKDCLTWNNGFKLCKLRQNVLTKKLPIEIRRLGKADVVIANFGLHYNINDKITGKRQLRNDMHMLAREVPKVKCHFVWRETTATHFNAPHGIWPGASYQQFLKLRSPSRSCAGMDLQDGESARKALWRNSVGELIGKATKHVIQMGNQTLSLPPNSHYSGRDCMHFCNPLGFVQMIVAYVTKCVVV